MAHPVNVQLDKGGWRSGLMWGLTGYDNEWNGLQTYPSARTTGWKMGWGYGALASNWTGDVTSASSFFRKSGLTVFPYAEAYVRPRISSDSADFARIPDEGLGASTVSATVSPYAAKTSWGVSGNLNGSVKEGNIQVQAFAQVGSTMYVGGNFTGVKQGEKGTEISSRGLAAFDVATGDFTGQTFDFNNQVKALVELPSGKLLAVGDFTKVNGETRVGTVLIDPATGQMATGWTQISGTWFYLSSSGVMRTGWVKDGGAWYYLSPSGSMVTGWQLLGGTWYHLGANGAMTTGWYQEGPVWFYLRSNGSMATGWELIGWSWYHFTPSGAWIG